MKRIFVFAVAGMSLLSACKPTEKNYRAAYDAAVAKRQAAEAEAMLPASGLISADGPQMRVVEGDTLFVESLRLRSDSAAWHQPAMAIAVSLYKMPTNARSAAAMLRDKGFRDAVAARATGDRWYVLAGGTESLKEAREFVKNFKKDMKEFPYIGLPGAPVIIRRPN